MSNQKKTNKNYNPFTIFLRQFIVVICILALAGLLFSRYQETEREKKDNTIEFSALVEKVGIKR